MNIRGDDRTLRQRAWLLAGAFALVLAGCGSDDALTADAGADLSFEVGETPVFDGCESTGDITNYEWVIVEGPEESDTGKVLRETMGECSFTLENSMELDDVGVWTIELTVTDGSGSSSDRVTVEVEG